MSSGSSEAMKPLVPMFTPSIGMGRSITWRATCKNVPSPPKEMISSASSAARRRGIMLESPGTSTNTGLITVSRPSASRNAFARMVSARLRSRYGFGERTIFFI